jgi:hypothetical protein
MLPRNKKYKSYDGEKVYLTAVDYINNRLFEVISPIYYTPLPDPILDGEIDPTYYEDSGAMGRSVATIAQMVDMRANNIPFSLVNVVDNIKIKEYLDMYVTELYLHKENPQAKAYLEKLSTLQQELTNNCKKLAYNDKFFEKQYVDKNLFLLIMGQGEHADAITEKYRVVSTK